MTNHNLLNTILNNGISYEEYKTILYNQVQNFNAEHSTDFEKEHFENRKLNLQRTNRLDKHFHPSDESSRVIQKITQTQIWMVLSETWCGDSAQNLPVIAAFSMRSELIRLKILFRDEHTEIMNLFLDEQRNKSIPKLVAFRENGEELFQWGPRPAEAKLLFEKLTSDGIAKNERSKALHLWYGRDRGITLEKELIELLNAHL